MIKIYFLFFLWLLPVSVQAENALLLKGKESSISLSGYMERFDDTSGKMQLHDILRLENSVKFKPIPEGINDGYSRKAIWLRFTLSRDASFPENTWLRFDTPYLDYVTVYVQKNDTAQDATSYSKFLLGDHIPVMQRPALSPDFMLPLQLPKNKSRVVYVRLQSISSLTFSAMVHTLHGMIIYNDKNILLQSSYLTLTLFVGFLNLLFFFRVGERLFLYFSFYAFAVFLNYLSISGFLVFIAPNEAHIISDYMADFGKGGGIFLFVLFLKQLFKNELNFWIRRYLDVMSLVGLLFFIADLFGFYVEFAPLGSIAVLLLFFMISWLCFKAIKNNEPAGQFFLFAFSVSNLGYFFHFVKLLGWVPIEWWNVNNIQFASLLNMLLITLALTERVRETEKRAIDALQATELRTVKLETQRITIERKQHFINMLSHEYRTPLAIINSSIDVLLLHTDASRMEYLQEFDRMKRAVHRLVEVMEVSLEKSRLNEHHEHQGIQLLTAASFFDAEITDIRSLWSKRKFVYVSTLLTQNIYVDPHSLKVALFNVLDNAQKYSLPDSSIFIDCYEEDQKVVVAIRNSSQVIVDDQNVLFEKYYRGGNSSGISGSGLGLWLVREIVESFRGSVELLHNNGDVVVLLRIPFFNQK